MAKKRRSAASPPSGVRIDGECDVVAPEGADRVEFSLRWRSSIHPEVAADFDAAMARIRALDPRDETLTDRAGMVIGCIEATIATIIANLGRMLGEQERDHLGHLGRIADDLEFARMKAAARQAALKKGPDRGPGTKRAPRKA